MGIEYFDTYVRHSNGFIAVKGEFVCICQFDRGQACFYRNRQMHQRPIASAHATTSPKDRRWLRETAVERMRKLNDGADHAGKGDDE